MALVPFLAYACAANDTSNNNGSGGKSGGSGGSNGSGGANAGSGGSNAGSGGMTTNPGGGGSKDAGVDAPHDMGGGTGGKSGTGGVTGGSGGASGNARCTTAGLTWKSGSKTTFESYPTNPQECIDNNGCAYVGLFSVCGDTPHSKAWVMSHNIVAAYPLGNLGLHDLCLKAGANTIIVTVLDTCSDSDCSGCCTQNRGNADALIDIESFTDMRFGINDGPIQWADLGPTTGGGCN